MMSSGFPAKIILEWRWARGPVAAFTLSTFSSMDLGIQIIFLKGNFLNYLKRNKVLNMSF